MKISRRRFLKRVLKVAGATVGVGAVGLGGLIWKIQPGRHLLCPRDNDARPALPKTRKRIVVVGGGLAGIAAATELQARNCEVTLIERAPQLGGKVGGWSIEALGRRFPMEHGFHGFFRQYYNLNELLSLAGAGADLVPVNDYPLLFANQPEERFGGGSRVFPINLLSVVRHSPSMHWSDFRRDGPGLEELMKYDPASTFARFDGMTFAEFIDKEGIRGGIVDTVLKPFAKASLNRIDRFSAAEAIRFFHFYFMGNPEGLAFRYAKRDSMAAVIEPLRERFEKLGGIVRTGLAARRIVTEKGRVTGVVVDGGTVPIPRMQIDLASVPEHGYRAIETANGQVFVTRETGDVVALDGRCTHMGCPVRWDQGTSEFHCPCHNGRFNGEGIPIDGPPKRALARLPVVEADGMMLIGGGAVPDEELVPCDHAVIACDSRGLRELIATLPRELISADYADRIARTGEADPYSVVRFWLDQPARPDRAPFYTVSGYPLTDSVAFYSQFQEPFVSWARETGGCVVECHAYGIAPGLIGTVSQYRDRFLNELQIIAPELRGARVLHEEAMAQENFTRFAPGDHQLRATTQTPIPNLFIAGDHVALPLPAFLMECAVMSGRFAANAILLAEGAREIPIPYLAPTGPLA